MKLIYTFFTFCLLLSMPGLLAAQPQSATGKISGTVVDATTKQPVGMASVVLLTPDDSSLVTGANTDFDGLFVMERVPFGRYIMRITVVGYPTRFSGISVSQGAPEVAAGTIRLKPKATTLREVEVVSQRELVQYDLDKKVVNISQDIAAENGSVAEALQNAPSVEVDIDGNVSMRGSSNVTILVDGKRTALANLSLDQIPANMIERVELITNPSSKYDPEGTGGIINLILKKDKTSGFNGIASLNAGTYDNYNSSLNLNYRYNKLSLNGGYDFRQRNRPGTSSSFRTTYHPNGNNPDRLSFLNQNQSRTNLDISHNIRFGVDYYLTPKHTLSASTLLRTSKERGTNRILYRFLGESQALDSAQTRNSTDREEDFSMDYVLGYRQTFDRKGQELTADFIYTNHLEDEFSNFEEVYEAAGRLPLLQHTGADNMFRRIVIQSDYVHPISENSKIEAGYRTSIQRMDTDNLFFNYDHTSGQWANDAGRSNHFVFDEYVHALYSNYSNKWNSISYQVGLRAEQTNTTSDQRTQQEVYRNNYFSLFPSVFITHDIDKDNKLQFSYSRRINRPRSRSLNPFINYTDPLNIRFGNPMLNPEFINSLELGHLKYWENSSLNSTVFYRRTTNQVQRFREFDPETGVTATSFINLSTGSNYGVEVVATHALTDWWRLNGSISGFRTELNDSQGDTELSTNQFSWNTKLNSSMNVWKDLSIQLSAQYRAPMVTIQGRMEQMYGVDLGIKKDVLKKQGTVSLRVTDIFDTREFNFLSFGPNFEMLNRNKRQTQMVYVGFTYRINRESNNQRNRDNQEDRDDTSDMEDGL
ncbi:outer membrane beta-barrel family protein [Pontibacter beigongshangensis]|uniref:outer membrane beta-barrel family protein n=1 Tax=Pontibacter beigongshangensis TaxID=2574733 RepID=UPI00164F18F3|nr:outer membrane beta-barrel family protein [Pontibacter beigongshangensis]